MKERVDVSIIAANYNNAEFLDDFINSVINSSVLPLELIIVDDKSTDASLAILNNYAYLTYLKIICLKKNNGFANALNIGISSAKGKYIMRVDPDDIIHPERIHKQYNFLQINPDISMVGSNVKYVSRRKKILFHSNLPIKNDLIYKTLESGDIAMFNGTLMGETHLFKKIGYSQKWANAEDYEFLTRLTLESCLLENMPDCLTYYRIHNQNNSQKNLLSTYRKIKQIRNEYYGKNTYDLVLFRNYLHMKLYRLYLGWFNNPLSYFFLILAIILRPAKLYNRLISR